MFGPSFPPAKKASPFRTITRREIVTGDYGIMRISDYDDTRVSVYVATIANADDLRKAAHVMSEIAEFLEENEKAGK